MVAQQSVWFWIETVDFQLIHFTVAVFFKSVLFDLRPSPSELFPLSPYQVMAFPPIKAHELESTLPLITSYSWWRASSFDLHLALGLMEKEMQPLS